MKIPLLYTVFIGTTWLLSSCATLLNSRQITLKIITDQPTRLIVANDTLISTNTNRSIVVDRSRADLKLTVFNDSLTRTLHVNSFNSAAYWANLGFYYGLGMLVDRNNPKRFGYPQMIYVNLDDKINEYQTFIPINNVHDRYWNIIKFTPLKVIGLSNPSVELSYERRTSRNFSTQVMGSYLLLLVDGFSNNRRTSDLAGFRFAVEERFYFKKSAPFGPYFAFEVDYLKNKFNQYGRYRSSQENTGEVAIRKQTYSGNFKIGYQLISDKISFDFFVGLGLRYKDVRHFATGSTKYDERGSFFNFFDANREGKYTVISVPMNVRIGYTF